METRLNLKIDDKISSKVSSLDNKVASLERKVDSLDNKVDYIKEMVMLLIYT